MAVLRTEVSWTTKPLCPGGTAISSPGFQPGVGPRGRVDLMRRALRSLTFFWKQSLTVALGAAVASTVLTGALVTGDSVRGSLRDLTLERLGGIDFALVAEHFFREDLAADLVHNQAAAAAAPLIVLRGT